MSLRFKLFERLDASDVVFFIVLRCASALAAHPCENVKVLSWKESYWLLCHVDHVTECFVLGFSVCLRERRRHCAHMIVSVIFL